MHLLYILISEFCHQIHLSELCELNFAMHLLNTDIFTLVNGYNYCALEHKSNFLHLYPSGPAP